MNRSVNGSSCTEYWDSDYNECVPWDEVPALVWDYLKPEWYEVLFLVLFSLVFVCGVIGNSLVCVVIWRHRDMRTVTNVFILNLALADLLVLWLVLFPTALQDIFESWFFSVAGCKMFKFIQRVSVLVSVLTLAVISVERYCAISNPLKFRSTLKRAGLLILAVWTLASIASSPDLWYYKSYAEFPSNVTSFLVRCKGYHPAGLIYFYPVAFFVLPFLVIAVAYIKIARCLWTSDVGQLSASDRCSDQRVTSQLAQRRKIARMLIAVVVCFFCCYLPHYFVFLLGDLVEVHNEDLYYAMVTAGHLLIYVNSAVNPIIYNFMSERFRDGFRDVCVCCQRFRKPPADNTVLRPLRDSSQYHDETKVSEI